MNNMNEIIKEYIIKTLELQKTRLKCINLGFNPSKNVKVELNLIDLSLKEIEKRWNNDT